MQQNRREITLEGSFNFRDLGGYQTEDDRIVKWGKLFRSGNLSQLTEADIEVIRQLGIKKICDLRGIDEIEKYPDPVLGDALWIHTPIVSDVKTVRQVGDVHAVTLENSKPGELLISLNRSMVGYTGAFKKVFDVLLDEPDKPMLFHCMAGKDRTGAVSALILSVLGVPREVIDQDYMYTNNAVEKMKANFDALGVTKNPNVEQAVMDAMVEARAEYINTFFDELENKYGTVEAYLKESIGLTDDDVQVLKNNLLD